MSRQEVNMKEEREEDHVDYKTGFSATADVQAAEVQHPNAHLAINLDAESKLGILFISNEAEKKYYHDVTIV